MFNIFSKFFIYLDNKSWFINLKLGLHQASTIPSLPHNVDLYYNHPLTRILRVIGGIVAVVVLLHKHLLCPYPLDIILPFIALAQFIQIFIINIIKLVYAVYYYRNYPEKYEVHNSPLNASASHLAKLSLCWKYGCTAAGAGVSLLATGVTIDTVLENSGRSKLIQPLINQVLGTIVPPTDPSYPRVISQNFQNKLISLSEANSRAEELSKALTEISKVDLTGYNLSISEQDEIRKCLTDFMRASQLEQENIRTDIFKLLNKENKK